MDDEIKTLEVGKPGASRWRRLSAAAGIVGLVGVGSVLAGSPAFADTYAGPYCGTYHSWNECLTYDFTTGNFGVAATNHYSVPEYETIWFTVNGYKYSETFTIPSGGTDGFAVHTGAGYASAGIDAITIVPGENY